MGEALFKCSFCDFSRVVEIDHGRISEPTLCANCNTNHCFNLIHNRSEFNDKQMIKLQESPGMKEIDIIFMFHFLRYLFGALLLISYIC